MRYKKMVNLKILECPDCKNELRFNKIKNVFNCQSCKSNHPINQEIITILPSSFTELGTSDNKILDEQKYQDSISNFYAKTYESSYVKKRWDYPILQKYLKYFKPESIVLDLGCGTGATSYFYAKNGFDVISSDLSTAHLQNVKGRDIKTLLIRSIAEKIPLKDNSVSQVVCSGSIHHFDNKKKSLEEIYRVLKKGGKLLVIENNNESLHKSLIPKFLRDFMQPHFKKKYGESIHEEESRDHDMKIKDFRKLFANAPFKSCSVQTFYFARIVSLAEKSNLVKFMFNVILKVLDNLIGLLKHKGFFAIFLLEK